MYFVTQPISAVIACSQHQSGNYEIIKIIMEYNYYVKLVNFVYNTILMKSKNKGRSLKNI